MRNIDDRARIDLSSSSYQSKHTRIISFRDSHKRSHITYKAIFERKIERFLLKRIYIIRETLCRESAIMIDRDSKTWHGNVRK